MESDITRRSVSSRNSIQKQGPSLSEAIEGYTSKKKSDHEILYRKRGPGGVETFYVFRDPSKHYRCICESTLRELILNEPGCNEETADRVIDSMNRSNDWERKEGMCVGDLKKAKTRLFKIQQWDPWLDGSDVKKALNDAFESRTEDERESLKRLAREEIRRAQQYLPTSAKGDKWMEMVRRVIEQVATTPDIDQLITDVGQAGPHRHLHYYSNDEAVRTRAGSSRMADISHLAGSLLGTDAWKAFRQEKIAAAEKVRLAIDLKYGTGIGERVFDAMRQQHGWKLEHGVEVHELDKMNDIARHLKEFDQWKGSKKAQRTWIAEACDDCGVDKAFLHEAGRWGVLQARINDALSLLPNTAKRSDVRRAVRVAVLQLALPDKLWIDGRSLFLRGGRFRDVEIEDAMSAFKGISDRAPSVDGKSRKWKVTVDGFERAVWVAQVCRECGIDEAGLDRDKVNAAIVEALRALPDKADTEQKRRAAHGAILLTVCKARWPQFRIDKALMRSLFQDKEGMRYDDDISDVHASFKLLASHPVNETGYEGTFQVRDWMRGNYERVRNKVALLCGISPEAFKVEEVWLSVATFVAERADRTRANRLMKQRLDLFGAQGEAESPEAYAKRLADARDLEVMEDAELAEQFERAADIALIQKLRPLPDDEGGTLLASLLNADGDRRNVPVGVIYWAAKETDVASFIAATDNFLLVQKAWRNDWLDRGLEEAIDAVTEYPDVDKRNLQINGRKAVKDALGLLMPLRPDPTSEEVERVVHGALIAEDLLARVRKAKPEEGYSRWERPLFDDVVHSLTLPGGSNYERDLGLAHKLLAGEANQGKLVTLATFKRALQNYDSIPPRRDSDPDDGPETRIDPSDLHGGGGDPYDQDELMPLPGARHSSEDEQDGLPDSESEIVPFIDADANGFEHLMSFDHMPVLPLIPLEPLAVTFRQDPRSLETLRREAMEIDLISPGPTNPVPKPAPQPGDKELRRDRIIEAAAEDYKLVAQKAKRLKPDQRIEAVSLWVASTVKAVAQNHAGAEAQTAPFPYIGRRDRHDPIQAEQTMGLEERIGQFAFVLALGTHFKTRIPDAFAIVAQPPLTLDKFKDALDQLLGPKAIPQELAALMLAARSQINAASTRRDTLMENFNGLPVNMSVVKLSETFLQGFENDEEQEACRNFVNILADAANPQHLEENKERRHLIKLARAAYANFAVPVSPAPIDIPPSIHSVRDRPVIPPLKLPLKSE